MEVKEGYKHTEVGFIPKEWDCVNLSEFIQINSGESPSKFKMLKHGVPYFKVEQLNNSIKYQERTPYFVDHSRCISAGSLIFPKRGAAIMLNKIRILAQDSFMDTNLMTLTPINAILSSEFLYYLLVKIELWRIADTTSVPQINNKHINSLFIQQPPLPEQQAIATALTDIDALINSLAKLIKKKKNIKHGTMQELLTGRKRIEGFSGQWIVRTMGELFNFSGGYSASREQLSNDGYCYLHYGDIHGSKKSYIDINSEYLTIPKLNVALNKVTKDKLLQDGDIVFVDASEDDEGVTKHIVVINPTNITYISGLHTIVAKARNDTLDKKFRQYCFQNSEIKKQFKFYAVGTKVTGISKSNISKINVLIPPTTEEQAAIADILSDMDSEIAVLEKKLDKYKDIKKGMMQELLTGRIRLV